MRLFPWRKLQIAAQLRERLVHGEPRLHRRDLDEDAARLAKINRLEVLAIENLGHLHTACDQLLAEAALFVRNRNRERHVVHGAETVDSRRRVRRVDELEPVPRRILADRQSRAMAGLACDPEAEHACQKVDALLRRANRERDAMKPADRRVLPHTAIAPRRPPIATVRDQLDREARWIGYDNRRLAEARLTRRDGQPVRGEARAPVGDRVGWYGQRRDGDLPGAM